MRAQLTAAAVGVLLLASGTSPASAEAGTITDPADVAPFLNDIRRVSVDHQEQRVVVRVKVTDLRRHSDAGPASLSLFLDTDETEPGPEFRLATGLYAGTDYQLVRMQDWQVSGEALTCAHRVRLDFATNVVALRVGHACAGSPEQVRVGVRTIDLWDGSHPVTDWLKGKRHLTRWFTAG